VAAASSGGPLWFQLYLWRDRGLTREVVSRAKGLGFQALCVGVDVPVVGRRERDSLGAVLTPGCDDVRALMERLRPTSTTSYDVNMRPSVTGVGPPIAKTVEATVALSDIVKASDEDLEALYPGESQDDAAARLLALGAAAVVVTRGAEGAVWYSATVRVSDPGVPVSVADTIGAGDTFGAAMLDELGTRGLLGGGVDAIGSMTREEAAGVLAFATRAAAVTVSRPGADPPYRSEL
jgi:fructokinase